jgi:hypothetical protein
MAQVALDVEHCAVAARGDPRQIPGDRGLSVALGARRHEHRTDAAVGTEIAQVCAQGQEVVDVGGRGWVAQRRPRERTTLVDQAQDRPAERGSLQAEKTNSSLLVEVPSTATFAKSQNRPACSISVGSTARTSRTSTASSAHASGNETAL